MEGERSLLHMIPHGPGRGELHSTTTSFAWHIEHNCTFDRLVRTTYTRIFACRTLYIGGGGYQPISFGGKNMKRGIEKGGNVKEKGRK